MGIVQVTRGMLEVLVHGVQLSPAEWALAVALLMAGSTHVALVYALWVRSTGDAPIGPRRAFTLGALAAGILTATIGASMGLYIVVTAGLGSPIGDHWGLDARTALVNTLVGLSIAGLYLWRLLVQRQIEARAVPVAHPAVAPVAAEPVRAVTGEPAADDVAIVLDAVLAGQITRELAAERLRAIRPAAESARKEVMMR